MSIRAETLVKQGFNALEKGNYPQAVDFFKRATEGAKDNPDYYAYLGAACFFTKQYEEAKNAFAEREKLILQRDYLHFEVEGYKACILSEEGKTEEAEKMLKEAVQQNVQSPQIYYELAILQMKRQEFREAKKNFLAMEKADPFFNYRKIQDLRSQL